MKLLAVRLKYIVMKYSRFEEFETRRIPSVSTSALLGSGVKTEVDIRIY